MTSERGTGRVLINITWNNGSSGQYHATAVNIHRSPSGGLYAGLRGTTGDTSGSGAAATWYSDGTIPVFQAGSYTWPLWCAPGDVVR